MKVEGSDLLIAVVIPCYKVKNHILGVLESIGPEVSMIFLVDDCCPDGSGDYAEVNSKDARITIIRNQMNLGVGGAVMAGYQAAISGGASIIIKIDGDGQMDPGLIPYFVEPIIAGEADYTKGNRFFNLEEIRVMPKVRLFGNAVLSLMAKLSTGYWDLFDPTNGYTAIHGDVAKHLPFEKISKRYFFEMDMLFRLNTIHAVVVDIPMDAKYEDEVSNLKISNIIGEFLFKSVRNASKRIFYNYYLRDMSLASLELVAGLILIHFGIVFGAYQWVKSAQDVMAATAGTVMLAALPILMGLQFILAFVGYDIATIPRRPRHISFRGPHIQVRSKKNR